ncbi:MAG TPA: right-handed parallel beta-helix repeat-containing protein [Solirubrobacteraceae bacterium]|nr:right-handed parallel beta-helix repeat-containing protein [Solirubrobacteraceae bacterium]
MMKTARRTLGLLAAAILIAASLATAAQAKTIKVVPNGSTESIQTAIDAAGPYDTVMVPPGTYSGPTVKVEKSNLTLKGSKAAIIDATGNTYGVTVGTKLTFDEGPTCPALSVSNFRIIGLTVENADDTGIFLFGVDGFHVTGGSYLNNDEYGIFPRCSHDGLINMNSGGGGDDATIYVGVDDGVTVEKNNLTNGELGIELESTDNSIVRSNTLKENTTGIFVIVLPGLPKSSTENAVIEENKVISNNRPNPFPPLCNEGEPENPPGCTEEFTDDLQLLPSGTGILNVGGHNITIRNNTVKSNGTVGVGVVENPFGFGSSNNTRVTGNTIKKNGESPDPRTKGSGDIVYLDNPENGSCISGNTFGTSFFPFGEPPACS